MRREVVHPWLIDGCECNQCKKMPSQLKISSCHCNARVECEGGCCESSRVVRHTVWCSPRDSICWKMIPATLMRCFIFTLLVGSIHSLFFDYDSKIKVDCENETNRGCYKNLCWAFCHRPYLYLDFLPMNDGPTWCFTQFPPHLMSRDVIWQIPRDGVIGQYGNYCENDSECGCQNCVLDGGCEEYFFRKPKIMMQPAYFDIIRARQRKEKEKKRHPLERDWCLPCSLYDFWCNCNKINPTWMHTPFAQARMYLLMCAFEDMLSFVSDQLDRSLESQSLTIGVWNKAAVFNLPRLCLLWA